LPNPVKVSFGKWCGWLIRRLQEPSFKLQRHCEWLALLVAQAAKHVIRQLAGIASDAVLTCSRRKSSTSLARAMVMKKGCHWEAAGGKVKG
jgi:hypothetical protein